MMTAKRKIASVARKVVDGTIGELEGCRAIVGLYADLAGPEADDADLAFLRGVESELDDIPLGAVRRHWAPDALAEKDRKCERFLKAMRPDILSACRALTEKWG